MVTNHLNGNSAGPAAISGRWGGDLIAQLPDAPHPGARCLEFGCGDGRAHGLIESRGYRWTGIDIAGTAMTARCDGHALPFADETFDLVVTVAVFEHLYDPFQAAREVARVLKPSGVLLGTTAFLEHFHANSYFHMTHLGVQRVFGLAGFQIDRLWPTWHFARALSTFWVPAQLGAPYRVVSGVAGSIGEGMLRLRAWGLRRYLAHRGVAGDEIDRRVASEALAWTGAIGFLARKRAAVNGNGSAG